VGKENQSAGHPFRLGIWIDGNFSWLSDGWTIHQRYVEDTLATDVTLTNASERITIACTDVVDFHEYVLVRKFTITNNGAAERAAKIFFHHDFHIHEQEVGDTAYYDPAQRALIVDRTPAVLQARTRAYWHLWVNAEPNDLSSLSPAVATLFRRSLLTVRTQIDHHGGIVAATDYDITAFARDTYAYIWPRDGAL